MIGYVTIGSNDLDGAAEYYDALLGTIGAKRLFDSETFIAWGKDMKTPSLAVAKPFDGNPATVGNGVMVAFAFKSPAEVDRFHARALELGGSDEGAPGDRGGRFYAGYFRDPEGNKLNAFCWTP